MREELELAPEPCRWVRGWSRLQLEDGRSDGSEAGVSGVGVSDPRDPEDTVTRGQVTSVF